MHQESRQRFVFLRGSLCFVKECIVPESHVIRFNFFFANAATALLWGPGRPISLGTKVDLGSVVRERDIYLFYASTGI